MEEQNQHTDILTNFQRWGGGNRKSTNALFIDRIRGGYKQTIPS